MYVVFRTLLSSFISSIHLFCFVYYRELQHYLKRQRVLAFSHLVLSVFLYISMSLYLYSLFPISFHTSVPLSHAVIAYVHHDV
jgi:hypothetical protein